MLQTVLHGRALLCVLSLFCVLASGCTEFHEVYYCGMYDPSPATQPTGGENIDSLVKQTELYKYDISGWSYGSKTQFASGLYDAAVVDTLFGEVRPARSAAASTATTPKSSSAPAPKKESSSRNKQSVSSSGHSTTAATSAPSVKESVGTKQFHEVSKSLTPTRDTARRIFVKIGPEGESIAQSDAERMVIFMSSDPQALTDRISAMANAQHTQAAVSAVISQGRTQQPEALIQTTQDNLAESRADASSILQQLQDATSDNDSVTVLTRQFIQSLRSSK